MTGVSHRSADAWQSMLAAVLTCLAGRWMIGGGFGYTVYLVLWLPILSAVIGRCRHPLVSAFRIVGLVVTACLPMWFDEGPLVAVQLQLFLLGLAMAVCGLADLAGVLFPAESASTISAVVWLLWVIVPLFRADWMVHVVSEKMADVVFSANPILCVNALSPTAADWTHQAIAYRWLTSLGQDVPFALPTHSLVVSVLYLIAGLAGLFVTRTSLFHVEHGIAVTQP